MAAIPKEQLVTRTVALYRQRFNDDPHFVITAPARVNLIGEHTDYNDGFVLPAAIDRHTVVVVGPGAADELRVYSDLVSQEVRLPLNNPTPSVKFPWTNYVLGVAAQLLKRGAKLRGSNLAIGTNIPLGAGVSSSASLELSSAYALVAVAGVQHFAPLDMIQLSQQAEHEFAGVRCGIMDQFISCLANKDTAMFIDCRTLTYDRVRIPDGVRLVICDTGVKRELAASAYNERRSQCIEGVRILSSVLPNIRALRDVTLGELRTHERILPADVRKRCRHVVTENDRVLQAVAALKRHDLSECGKLMYQSHMSLKNDYEVSSPELDAVVDICAEEPGVIGARMTGAGFGGSAVCLVNEESADSVRNRLQREYPRRTGRKPDVFVCSVEDGVTVHKL